MTRLARGAKCGPRGASGLSASIGWPARATVGSPRSAARLSVPMPMPQRCSNSRRLRLASCAMTITLIDKDQFVAHQQHLYVFFPGGQRLFRRSARTIELFLRIPFDLGVSGSDDRRPEIIVVV